MDDRKPESLSLFQLLPNLVTILGLCAGLTAIRFLMSGRFDLAVMLLVFAAVIDGFDGLLARRLHATSHFGAELDSLSDFVNFGVVPGILVYQFALVDARATGWIFVLVYSVSCCLRLARFNVNRDAPPPEGRAKFTGVPAPGGALLALLPLFLSFQGVLDTRAYPLACGIYLGIVGLLMTSRVPTPSLKAMRIPREKAGFILIGMAIVLGLLITRFWLLMMAATLTYAAVILYAVFFYLRRTGAKQGKP
ncbi:MAG: CDP-diacylglycerol--serine O-phosphatidyltransferase [Paracoccaceae bacterium]|nr:CDP-diacylglycerol--serine O-phosphatidyltransferase [Paracoccaceae bacterium]